MVEFTIDQIEELREAILSNANELISEATLLLEAGHHARAYVLAQFATEELAKLPMIIRAGIEIDAGIGVDWKRLNARLLNHKSKISLLHTMEHSKEGVPPDISYEFLKEKERERSDRNRRKNEALYAHFDGHKVQRPAESISSLEAQDCVGKARRLFEDFEPVAHFTRGSIKGMGIKWLEFSKQLSEDKDEQSDA